MGTYEAERTDFGCEGGGCADLTASRAQVDDLDLVGILERGGESSRKKIRTFL